MNKRPLGPTGLPAKPGNPGVPHHQPSYSGTPGPAPPLPAGPMPQQYPQQPQQQMQQYPQQQQYQQQGQMQGQGQAQQAVDPAAHAAAWAAYYQATGQPNPYAQSQPQPQPTIGTSPNPQAGPSGAYANYGYGAGATHVNHLQPSQPSPSVQQGGYQYPQPQAQVQQYGAPQMQVQVQAPNYGNYGPQQPQAMQAPGAAQGYRPPMPQQQAGFGYNSPVPQQPFQPQQAPLYAHQQQQQQTYYPQQNPQQQQGFRPGMTPSPARPYQPRPPRPPGMSMSPTPSQGLPMGGQGGIPPAKRPRFDGPGGAAGGMQPPSRPAGPMGINNGQPGFAPGASGSGRPPIPIPSAAPIHLGLGIARPPVAPPIVRPPIHLGMGGPPPPGIIAPRGPSFARGGAGLGGRGGRGGAVQVPGAPRGPAGMAGFGGRRGGATAAFAGTRRGGYVSGADRDRDERERERERERRREKERGPGTTMTDFRIVGIQISGASILANSEGGDEGWKWGWTEDEARAHHPPAALEEAEAEVKKAEEADRKEETTVKLEVESLDGDNEERTEPTSGGKAEPDMSVMEAEEKRGEKRKAKSPDGEEEPEGSSKKRAALASNPSQSEVTPSQPATTPEIQEEKTEIETSTTIKSEVSTDIPNGLPPKPNLDTPIPSTDIPPSTTNTSIPESTPEPAQPEPVNKFEEPQNRFRIYFDSPPELDRIPKAIRRGNNKRWRRESSSLAPATPRKADAEVKEGGEVLKEEAGAGEEVAKPQEESAVVPTEAEEVSTDVSKDAEAKVDTAEVPQEEAVMVALEVKADVTETGDAEAAGEEEAVEDVSMRSDIGALVDVIEEQVSAESDDNASPPAPESEAQILALPTSEIEQPPTSHAATSETAHDQPDNEADVEDEADANSVSAVPTSAAPSGPQPSVNRISILYEESSRRICVDAEAVESVRIYRAEGKIEVCLKAEVVSTAEGEKKEVVEGKVEGELRRGVLMEMYDTADERFVALSSSRLAEIYSSSIPSEPNAESTESSTNTTSESVPPLHHTGPMTITVWLNKKRPLSEPKWCRSNSADDWLIETFTSRRTTDTSRLFFDESGWKGKLHVVDPDPAPTLASILLGWTNSAMSGTLDDRKSFIDSLTATNDPADLLEILLKLARGERNPTLGGGGGGREGGSGSGGTGGGGGGFGSLAGVIRPHSPFASHQTHVSLAVLQMFRLTVAYADQAGVQGDAIREKVEDIVRSLPVGMIQRSLDGLFREWVGDKVATAAAAAAGGKEKV